MGSIKGVLRGHYSTKCIRPNQVICEQCEKRYRRVQSLIQHIQTRHLNHSVVCLVCNKQFISVSVCNRHLRNMHNITQGQFNLRLVQHAQTTDEKPSTNVPISTGYKSFPQMSKCLSFKDDTKFGKHIVANCDIDVGNKILATPVFASIEYLSSITERCFECGKDKTINFIACPHCINVFFCSKKCSMNEIHKSKCRKWFDSSDCFIVRLGTEMIKEAFRSATDIKSFAEFCSGILFFNKKSMDCCPPYSHYGEMLQLKGFTKKTHTAMARQVVKCIKQLPELVGLDFRIYERLIFHLAHRRITTIEINSFSEEETITNSGILTRFSIYDVVSRINHSCDPNVYHFISDDNSMNCIVSRPIETGEQIFINYLGQMQFDTTQARKNYLKNHWNFDCICEKCRENGV